MPPKKILATSPQHVVSFARGYFPPREQRRSLRFLRMSNSYFRLLLLLGLFVCVGVGRSAVDERRVGALFRPFLGERLTLSPDGKYIAYTEHAGSDLTVVIMDPKFPAGKKTVIVDEDRVVEQSKERQRAALRFLRWATPTRLVMAPTVQYLRPAVRGSSLGVTAPASITAPILAVDADGRNARTLVTAETFQATLPDLPSLEDPPRLRPPRTVPRAARILGFAARVPGQLLLSVNGVGAAPGLSPIPSEIFRLDVHTGKLKSLGEDPTLLAGNYDRDGRLRLIVNGGSSRLPRTTFLYRAIDSSRWKELHELAPESDAARFVVSPETYFDERAMPLGFDFDPNVLIYAANIGRDTVGIYGLNLTTMRRTVLALEHATRDLATLSATLPSDALVFDDARQMFVGVRAPGSPPLTVWVDRELAEVQRGLEAKFPGRSIEIVEWDDERGRILFHVTDETDPGRTFLLQRREQVLLEVLRRAPWLPDEVLHDSRFVEFAGPGGAQLSGYLTLPRSPRASLAPLVIVFASGLPATAHAEFDREAHVLADMGLAVLRLNQRGVLGRGTRQREAVRGGLDRAAADDALAAIAWVAARHPIDRKRVVAMGEKFGGFLAARAAQLEPEAFRCVVANEPMLQPSVALQPPPNVHGDPPSFQQEVSRIYLERMAPRLHELDVTSHADASVHPVFVVYRSHRADAIAQGVATLRSQLRRRDVPHEMHDVGDDYFHELPGARTRAYRALEEFLNLNLYHYDVKIGPTRVVK